MDELANRVVRHMLGSEGFDWDVAIEDAALGYARISMRIRPDMANSHGIAHGGMIFALGDTACAYASNTNNEAAVTASASIIYLAPARIDDVLIAEARVLARQGRTAAVCVAIRKRDGTPIAEFQGQSRTIGGAMIENGNQENDHG